MGNAMGRYAVGRSGTRIPYCHREGIQRLAMTNIFLSISENGIVPEKNPNAPHAPIGHSGLFPMHRF